MACDDGLMIQSLYLGRANIRPISQASRLKKGAAAYPLVDELKTIDVQLLFCLHISNDKERVMRMMKWRMQNPYTMKWKIRDYPILLPVQVQILS